MVMECLPDGMGSNTGRIKCPPVKAKQEYKLNFLSVQPVKHVLSATQNRQNKES